MCGVFAWWPGVPSPENQAKAQAGLAALRDRGPDDEGLWVAPGHAAYLGHRRLTITGQNGVQPLWNAQRTVACIVNGQFYDFRRLRARFEREGYAFQSDSDSELLLAAYATHGLDALKMLEGEFAFVLWDMDMDMVWAVRDRAGVKPLRFTRGPRGLAFASEAKAFFAAGWPARWDDIALAQALSVQYPDPTRTLFDGIGQLAPGESMVCTRVNGHWRLDRSTWWDWFTLPVEDVPREQAVEQLDQALRTAVFRRVDTPWPVAVHLSAGLDSTAILAATVQTRIGGVQAFSVGFEPPDEGAQLVHDECEQAKRTALRLGVPWTRVDASRQALLRHWDEAVHRAENIGINGHLVAKWLLARAVHHEGFRVCLSGEGADEALLGYAHLAAQASGQDPTSLDHLRANNPVARGLMLPEGDELDLSEVERAWGFVPVWLHAKASLGHRIQSLMKPAWRDEVCQEALRQWAQATAPSIKRDPVHAAAASWARLALGGYILPTLADAPEAGWHIQGRVPFLDAKLLDAVMRFSTATAGCPERPKAPLRQWLHDQGLHEVADRPKHPFQAPPMWGCPQVRQVLRDRWSRPGHWDNTPFDQDAVLACLDELDAGSAQQHQLFEPVIATLLSVESLVKAFGMDGGH